MKKHKIYSDNIEPAALSQFYDAMKCDFVIRGALMPDAHMGYSLPIGAVVATEKHIVPAWIGYDIGCGMCALKTTYDKNEINSNATDIFNKIYKTIPVGFNHNKTDSKWDQHNSFEISPFLKNIFKVNGLKQLGTLGGGNHFIEIGYDENDSVWIILHSGSRNIGHQVATYYMKLAANSTKAVEGNFPLQIDTVNGMNYIDDMNFCLEFALENRKNMLKRIITCIDTVCKGTCYWKELINRNHNHAQLKDNMWIHRKGATHAELNMMGVIPGNMRDGSFIVKGKGNEESLWSSSHGAGRVLGRNAAKKSINLSDFQETMKNVIAKVDNSTLDESPFAYKNIFTVMEDQKDLVEVVHLVKPIINIKG